MGKSSNKSKRFENIKYRYNISKDDYNDLLDNQNNRCPICGKELTDRNTHIDHNHETNSVRGLLCSTCNTGLGKFKDSQDNLFKAMKYLDNNET